MKKFVTHVSHGVANAEMPLTRDESAPNILGRTSSSALLQWPPLDPRRAGRRPHLTEASRWHTDHSTMGSAARWLDYVLDGISGPPRMSAAEALAGQATCQFAGRFLPRKAFAMSHAQPRKSHPRAWWNNAEKVGTIEDALTNGAGVAEAIRQAGVSERSYYTGLGRDPALRQRLLTARAAGKHLRVDRIEERILDQAEGVGPEAETMPARDKTLARFFVLKGQRRADYGEQVVVDHRINLADAVTLAIEKGKAAELEGDVVDVQPLAAATPEDLVTVDKDPLSTPTKKARQSSRRAVVVRPAGEPDPLGSNAELGGCPPAGELDDGDAAPPARNHNGDLSGLPQPREKCAPPKGPEEES